MAAPQNFVSVTRRPPDVEDYIDMLRRYRSWLIGPMFAGLVISVVVAFLWQDTYVSTAVMRITPQQISDRLVPTIVNMQMMQRVEQMKQEILSRASLTELVKRPALNLYPKEQARYPMEDIISDMRNKAIKIQTMELPGAGGGRIASAFTISFTYPDRFKAQAVVGSSRISIRGLSTSTLATARRWRSPLLSMNGSLWRSLRRPTASSASSHRRRISSSAKPKLRVPNATSSCTVAAKI